MGKGCARLGRASRSFEVSQVHRLKGLVVGAPSSHLPVRASHQHNALSNAHALLQHKA